MARKLRSRSRRQEDENRAQGEHDPVISFRLPRWKKDALIRLAREEGKTTSNLLNEIIDDTLEACGRYSGADIQSPNPS